MILWEGKKTIFVPVSEVNGFFDGDTLLHVQVLTQDKLSDWGIPNVQISIRKLKTKTKEFQSTYIYILVFFYSLILFQLTPFLFSFLFLFIIFSFYFFPSADSLSCLSLSIFLVLSLSLSFSLSLLSPLLFAIVSFSLFSFFVPPFFFSFFPSLHIAFLNP